MWRSVLSGLLLVSVTCAGGRALAAQGDRPGPPDWPAGTSEIAVLGGWATGKVFDPPRTPTDLAQVLVRYAYHFTAAGSSWRRGNFALVVEGMPFFTIDQEPRATGGGVNLMVRYALSRERVRPLIILGAGLLGTDERVPPGETRLNFTPQAGVGAQVSLGPRLFLDLEYRFHHISNNGRTENNPGINSHLLLVGLSWFLR